MSDLECLLAYVKQCHEAKDAADILDIAQDIQQLDFFYQMKNQSAVIQLVQNVINKHRAEVDKHDKGRPQAQTFQQLYYSCRSFLVRLGEEKIEKKAKEKVTEELLEHP